LEADPMPIPTPIRAVSLALAAVLAFAAPARAQVANPGDAARSEARKLPPPEEPQPNEGRARRIPSYEQPPVEPPGAPVRELAEEDRIGAYGQPRWTAHRRFPTTRIYVRPEGYFELEWWIRNKVPRHGAPAETLTQFEAELGLGHRLQLDLYLDAEKVGHDDEFKLAGERIELRYALADWDVIPGNPTLYFEYHAKDGPDAVEGKLLLGGEIAPRWHWGINGVFEREISGALTNEFAVTAGVSYTVLDTRLSLGAEGKLAFANTREDRGSFSTEALLGPSIQWRPLPASHIDIAPLFGLSEESPVVETFIVVGWEF
jgi:hypothetical protein